MHDYTEGQSNMFEQTLELMKESNKTKINFRTLWLNFMLFDETHRTSSCTRVMPFASFYLGSCGTLSTYLCHTKFGRNLKRCFYVHYLLSQCTCCVWSHRPSLLRRNSFCVQNETRFWEIGIQNFIILKAHSINLWVDNATASNVSSFLSVLFLIFFAGAHHTLSEAKRAVSQ